MGNTGGVIIPGERESSRNFLLLGRETVSAEGCGSQGACTSTPVLLECLAQVPGAQEALLVGGGQSDVNKVLKLCWAMMTQESHTIPRSC